MSDSKDADRNASRQITFELSPEMYTILQKLAAASGQSLDGVLNRAIALYKASLDALHEGKHIGVAGRPESLETEFVGLTPTASR
jgi:predicted transcriptional regulator